MVFSRWSEVADILVQEHGILQNVADRIVQSFLINFRLCPSRPDADLDEWRMLLWAQALGDEYASITGNVYEQWLSLRWQFLSLRPEVKKLLIRLRERFLLALITNGPSNAQWEKIKRVKVSQYFDLILVSGDLPWEKPDHRIFHEACEMLSVRPVDCLMVGDKLETDIVGGQLASLGATVWIPLFPSSVKHHFNGNETQPDHTIKSVLELPFLLSKDSEPPAFLTAKRGPVNKRLSCISHFDLDDANSNASDGS